MELVRKNIHMERIKCSAETQITLEDDRNVPDQKPDMERIILRRGEVKTEEIKATEDKVNIKGKLLFAILYRTEEDSVSYIEGELPFEEQVYMECVQSGDNVEVDAELEDLSVEMINSRKLSIRALVSLELETEELYDEELAVDLYHEEAVETKKTMLTVAEIAIQKKDILRRREELEMPQNFPNIFEILWKEVRVNALNFEALDNQISVQGELEVFLLYEGEGEERPLKCYEKVIPFREILDCQGSGEKMIEDISGRISHSELEVRTDDDGEERIVCLDLLLDLNIKLYEEEGLEALSDAYGITENIMTVKRQGLLNRRVLRATGKTKLTEQVKLPASLPEMAEIYHSSASAVLEATEMVEGGAEVIGTLSMTILYRAENGELASFEAQMPFEYMMTVPDMAENCRYRIVPVPEQSSAAMLSGSEMDLKAVVAFELLGFCSSEEEMICDISMEKVDTSVINELPGIVAYIAREGDNIWELGKKYYVPLERIREINQLSGDVLKSGEKVLVVR